MMTDDPRSGTRSAATAGGRGRWIWIVTAVATTVVVIAVVASAIHIRKAVHFGISAVRPWTSTSVQTVTFRQPATALDVHDSGGPVAVSAGGEGGIQVTEIVSYNGTRPPIQQSVASRRLTLADPACNGGQCSVAFRVTVPAGTSARLESDGGPITVSGLTGPVDADSGGGPLTAQSVSGGLNAQTGGGGLTVRNESGTLSASTGGGPADLTGIAATDATVSTDGGGATLALSAVPHHVQAASGGGPVTVQVPVGSYAVSADSGGGPQDIGVATDPASPDTINVSSGGGGLAIQ
jgi:hypothetical protein